MGADGSQDRWRALLAGIAVAVALTLVFAPVTMQDWAEGARVEAASLGDEAPSTDADVLEYANLPHDDQVAVRRAVASSSGSISVYGQEDWPERLVVAHAPQIGHGVHVVEYNEEFYRVEVRVMSGLPPIYWIFQTPFVVYGIGLLVLTDRFSRDQGAASAGVLAVTTGIGAGFHLLGPAFDFRFVGQGDFLGLGIAGAVGLVVALIGLEPPGDRSDGDGGESDGFGR